MNFNKNKEIIYNKLDEIKTHPTVHELYSVLKKDHPKIGIATVYRNLNQLLNEDRIIKISYPNEKDRFDATLKTHHHSMCVKCGKVEDINLNLDYKINSDIDIVNVEFYVNHICKKCKTK